MADFVRGKSQGLYRFVIGMCILTLIASGLVFVRMWYRGSLGYAFLIWNIFLAWIPLVFSIILTRHQFRSRIVKWVTAFFWLMFYPNAPYIITDFIHLSPYNFYKSDAFAFNSSYKIWYDFFLISIFVITGLVLAYVSLRLIQNRVRESHGSIAGWVFTALVSLLSGYAIYLGRFIRVNSWEVVTKPLELIKILFGNLNTQGIIYTLLFGFMIFFIYLVFSFIEDFRR